MSPGQMSRGRLSVVLVAMALAAGWLAEPVADPAPVAAQVAQQPSPVPRVSPTPTPILSPEEQLQVLQGRKVQEEIRLIDMQEERTRQERDTQRQPWRAPAEAIATVGPTLVGLGLLYLLARALSRLLPPEPVSAKPAPETSREDDEDEEDL